MITPTSAKLGKIRTDQLNLRHVLVFDRAEVMTLFFYNWSIA
jgi:hypothetical protein